MKIVRKEDRCGDRIGAFQPGDCVKLVKCPEDTHLEGNLYLVGCRCLLNLESGGDIFIDGCQDDLFCRVDAEIHIK